jgi:hypothetical protein
MTEKCADIAGFESAYMVSSHYRVASMSRIVARSNGRPYRVRSRVLRLKTHLPSGLQSVTLSVDGRQHNAYVHRLVADAFGPSAIRHRAPSQQTTGWAVGESTQAGRQQNTSRSRKAS